MASSAGPSAATELDYGRLPDKAGDDADTCRICRNEGSLEEPLFYPCKCSGSIKFVHQECLMEWLSHSQKKYCELCKTSFRFTKLYHPAMPNHIPTSVFIRRALVHVLKMLWTWCRAVLVGSVWLVFLPYCMRVVWRSLFWVGDGGWSREHLVANSTQQSGNEPWDISQVQTTVDSETMSNASANLTLPGLLTSFSHVLNASSIAGEPIMWTLVKRFFFGVSYPSIDTALPSGTSNTTSNSTVDTLGMRSPSLLSDVSFFQWFPSSTANRFLIDVLEGQIITLLVAVAFILIFLIREWVVQQQPVINMVALGEDAANRPPMPPAPADEEVDEEEGEANVDEEDEEDDEVYRNPAETVEAENEATEPASSGEASSRRPLNDIQKRRVVLDMLRESDDIPQDLLDAIAAGSHEDVVRIIEQMPLLESLKLKEKLITFSERLQSVDTVEAENEAHAGPSGSNRATQTDAEESSDQDLDRRGQSDNDPDGNEGAEKDVPKRSSTPQRPNMPTRNRSFIATEIQRNLEEGETWSFANAPRISEEIQSAEGRGIPDSWEDEATGSGDPEVDLRGDAHANDQDPDSENSSESWQQIPDIIVDEVSNETEDQAVEVKGQGPNIDETHEHIQEESASTNTTPSERSDATDEDDDVQHDEAQPIVVPSIRDPLLETAERRQQDVPELEQTQAPVTLPEPPPHRIFDYVLDWLFGDIAPGVQAVEDDGNDEHIVQDLADEPPFVPFAANEPIGPDNEGIQDPEVAAAAARAGIDVNDQDAIDDAEDLEGIMELIGMQGPITGLFQNAMFSAVLVSATLACAVWFPYLWGKVVLLFMGSPISLFIKMPLRLIATLADLLVDTAILLSAETIYWSLQAVRSVCFYITLGFSQAYFEKPVNLLAAPARSVAKEAFGRLAYLISKTSPPHPDYFRLSINSHAALRSIQNTTNHALNGTSNAVAALYNDVITNPSSKASYRALQGAPSALYRAANGVIEKVRDLISWLWNTKSYKITMDLGSGTNIAAAPSDVEPWTATDRIIAVFVGYAFFALVGAIYLRRGRFISSSRQGRKIEAIVTEVLQQAGGVLKVILIISIEMLAFPLYCGLLLDIALLPLFKDAGLYTRWQFARESPWTSGFVHWFIGTCYMFHFALFVSMCRKIMRKGVLYFIRDPDDPTFHPVRDVLERNVTTQLRKIAFSALVYGALVIVCLGGVVWALSRATAGVLPIHWTSQAPSLEFPLNLLFYNFLTPFVIRVFKPSDGLHTVYQWWFKSCARLLRLSNFLFGDDAKEERGRFAGLSWSSWFTGKGLDPEEPKPGVRFLKDGKFVRAPASDQARIPKGQRVFIEVDESNHRLDGKSEEGGIHNDSDMVTKVYIPPWFRVRIFCFVLTIWIFAACTGISITIVPLLFGRYLFSLFLPSNVGMDDIHAFSLGIYTLGTLAYGFFHLYKFVKSLNQPIPNPISTIITVAATVARFALRVTRFLYVWTTLVLVVPFLFAMLLELFFLMPLHAYLGPSEPHVIHIIQDWTLGFLYARLAARIIFADRTTRAARAFSAVIADGYLNPNARLATRRFLLPVSVMFGVAVTLPTILAWTLNRTIAASASATTKSLVWRFSYPALGFCLLSIWAGREGLTMLRRWRMVVRDEVYLIGERLHNFGERRTPQSNAVPKTKAD